MGEAGWLTWEAEQVPAAVELPNLCEVLGEANAANKLQLVGHPHGLPAKFTTRPSQDATHSSCCH